MTGSAVSATEGDEVIPATMGGTIIGDVVDDKTTVPGATVVLINGTTIYRAETSTPHGKFNITGVAPGTYLAYAEKSGYNKTYFEEPVIVQDGVVSYVNITMTMQLAWLSGMVTYGGFPAEGALVTLESGNDDKFTATTGDDGRYSIRVPSGEYAITFSKNGYNDAKVTKVLLPAQENTADVELKRSALPGNTGFINDYDLSHSMMVVGLFLAVTTMVSALALRFRGMARPELLPRSNEEKKK